MMENKFSGCFINNFILEEEIFRGNSNSIWRSKFKFDDKKYVLKEIKLSNRITLKEAMKEVELLRQLDHKNCIRYYGHFYDDLKKILWIVLEYCEYGDLSHVITSKRNTNNNNNNNNNHFDESYIWSLFYEICLGVQHLHQLGIVHRDLKTSNIFLKDLNTPKIGDLGVSHQLSENTLMLQTFSGTPLYLSPELVRGQLYTEKTDIWSLGIILYELCTFTPPFTGTTLLNLAQAIENSEIPSIPSIYYNDGKSSKLERCIKWLLQRDYRLRPSISQLIEKLERQLSKSHNTILPSLTNNVESRLNKNNHQNNSANEVLPVQLDLNRKSIVSDIIVVDINRLTTMEKRDKLILRKLLQTKMLSNTNTNTNTNTNLNSNERNDNNNYNNYDNHGNKKPASSSSTSTSSSSQQPSLSSSSSNLGVQIQDVQERLAKLSDAITSGGRIEREIAEWLGISTRSQTPKIQSEIPRNNSNNSNNNNNNSNNSNNNNNNNNSNISNNSNHQPNSQSSHRSSIVFDTKKNLPNEGKPSEIIFQNHPQRQSPFASSTNQFSEHTNNLSSRNQNNQNNQQPQPPQQSQRPRSAIYSRGYGNNSHTSRNEDLSQLNPNYPKGRDGKSESKSARYNIITGSY